MEGGLKHASLVVVCLVDTYTAEVLVDNSADLVRAALHYFSELPIEGEREVRFAEGLDSPVRMACALWSSAARTLSRPEGMADDVSCVPEHPGGPVFRGKRALPFVRE